MSTVAEQPPELVSRIKAGDSAAEAEFVERYARFVRILMLKRTGSRQLANDLCQDTLIVVLCKLRGGELKNPHSLPSFVRQTAVNISIGHFRKERRYVHRDDGNISLLVAHQDHKANRVDRNKMRLALLQLLGQLSVQRDREILCRYYLLDEDKDRIREDLHLSSAHFDRVLYRARKRMQSIVSRQKGLKTRLCEELYEA